MLRACHIATALLEYFERNSHSQQFFFNERFPQSDSRFFNLIFSCDCVYKGSHVRVFSFIIKDYILKRQNQKLFFMQLACLVSFAHIILNLRESLPFLFRLSLYVFEYSWRDQTYYSCSIHDPLKETLPQNISFCHTKEEALRTPEFNLENTLRL